MPRTGVVRVTVSQFFRSVFIYLIFCDLALSQAYRPFPPVKVTASTQVEFEDFVGSKVCGECHGAVYDEWRESTHGQAGGAPSEDMVIGRFDGEPRHYSDATVTPLRDKKGDYRFIVEWLGEKKDIKVDGIVGKGHMVGGGTQTYFSRFSDGTMRLVPFDFHRGDSVWFSETSTSQGWVPISKDLSMLSLSEWPPNRTLGTIAQAQSCQQCHGSQIELKFDYSKKKYQTRFMALDINCESCHGPGRRHVDITKKSDWKSRKDIGLTSLSTLAKDDALNVCFQCHALKDQIDTDYLPGKDLEAHYSLKFPMLGDTPYNPDGRVRAFGYQQNHVFSDCYINGSMACADCHSPHSLSYRDINGEELQGRFDNGQCTACHASKALDVKAHTFPQEISEGSRCTSCHMPYLQQKATGRLLRYARSDHSISIPRPVFDDLLGSENACSQCHTEMTISSLQQTVNRWYGDVKPHKHLVTELLKNMNEPLPIMYPELLGSTEDPPAMIFAGLAYFFDNLLTPDMATIPDDIMNKLKSLVESTDVDIKALSLASIHMSRGANNDTHRFLVQQISQLGESEKKTRDRWALALAYRAKKYRDEKQFDFAITVYRKSLEIENDNSTTLGNLALTFQQKGDIIKAAQTFKMALKKAPNDWALWVNYGNLLWNQKNRVEASKAYEKAIDINPHYSLAHFNMGNIYYGNGNYNQARDHYEKTVELDPSIALAHFYLARTYLKLQLGQKALASVERAVVLDSSYESARMMRQDLRQILGR